VWVIKCDNGAALAATGAASTAPVAVAPPDTSDKEDQTNVLPEDAGK
jgi:hypothetical protein